MAISTFVGGFVFAESLYSLCPLSTFKGRISGRVSYIGVKIFFSGFNLQRNCLKDSKGNSRKLPRRDRISVLSIYSLLND